MPIIGTLPNNIQNGQIADAAPVMANFNFLVNQVNANAQSGTTPPPGTLLNVQGFSASGTYTPTAGTNFVIIEAVGGGGGGGGATATGGSQVSAGGPGGAGAYARHRALSAFSGVAVTIGAGGAGGTGANGSAGGTTSFGAILSVGGGGGGLVSTGSLAYGVPGVGGGVILGGNIVGSSGTVASYGSLCSLSIGLVTAANGPASFLGTQTGAGGRGTGVGGSSGAATGQAGAAGLVLIYEYS